MEQRTQDRENSGNALGKQKHNNFPNARNHKFKMTQKIGHKIIEGYWPAEQSSWTLIALDSF